MGNLLTREQFQKILEELNPYSHFEVIEYTGMTKPVKIHCLECDTIKEYKIRVNNGNIISQKVHPRLFSSGSRSVYCLIEVKSYLNLIC